MNILITSGGTSEKIDRVRSITNHSTGRLGKIIAETFLDKGDQVTLVTTPKAVCPAAHPNLTIILIENVAELLEKLEPLVFDIATRTYRTIGPVVAPAFKIGLKYK